MALHRADAEDIQCKLPGSLPKNCADANGCTCTKCRGIDDYGIGGCDDTVLFIYLSDFLMIISFSAWPKIESRNNDQQYQLFLSSSSTQGMVSLLTKDHVSLARAATV